MLIGGKRVRMATICCEIENNKRWKKNRQVTSGGTRSFSQRDSSSSCHWIGGRVRRAQGVRTSDKGIRFYAFSIYFVLSISLSLSTKTRQLARLLMSMINGCLRVSGRRGGVLIAWVEAERQWESYLRMAVIFY